MNSRITDLTIGWGLWNLVLLAPVLAPVCLGEQFAAVVPGFLSYCYALLAISCYLFIQHFKATPNNPSWIDSRMAVLLLAMMVIMIFYFAYEPATTGLTLCSLIPICTVLFLVCFVLAYWTQTPILKRQAEEEEKKEKEMRDRMKKVHQTGDDTRENAFAVVEAFNENE